MSSAGLLRRGQKLMVLGSLVAALGVLIVIAIALWHYRGEAEARARLSGDNLTRSIEAQVESHIRSYGSILQLMIDLYGDPRFRAQPPEMWEAFLKDLSTVADYVGSILILDQTGRVIHGSLQSGAELDLSDRDYFRAQRADANAGLFISAPFRSRLRDGEWSIALSRRLPSPDGGFAGIVTVAIRLEFVASLLRHLALGEDDTISLFDSGGRIVMRYPSEDGTGDIGRDVSASANFKRMRADGDGTFTAHASIDDVERLFTFSRIGDTDLYINVGLGTREAFSQWRLWSAIVAAMAFLLSGSMVLLAILLGRELNLRARAEAELADLAATDFLTGLPNRRRFDDQFLTLWRRSRRTGTPLSLLIIDVDHFKAVNDRYGHALGDQMLKAIADGIAAGARRPGDMPARIGGEEFAVILADTAGEDAVSVAEDIRQRILTTTIAGASETIPSATISVGVAALAEGSDISATLLFEAADKALYGAKLSGRNRVHRFDPVPSDPAV